MRRVHKFDGAGARPIGVSLCRLPCASVACNQPCARGRHSAGIICASQRAGARRRADYGAALKWNGIRSVERAGVSG
jgi:hypothetical protein